jgi:Bromodomain
VDVALVPDYSNFVKRPIAFSTISNKISSYMYTSVEEFRDDLKLIVNNAKMYNHPDTIYHKAAIKLDATVDVVISELEASAGQINMVNGNWDTPITQEYLKSVEIMDRVVKELLSTDPVEETEEVVDENK